MDAYSRTVARLELFSDVEFRAESSCGQATAFFYRHNGELFLITNWHVVTGMDPTTMQPVANGLAPAAMMIEYKQSVDANGVPTAGTNPLANFQMPLVLYKNNAPVWFEHSTRQKC